MMGRAFKTAEKYKQCIVFAIGIGLLTYGYMMANKIPNWDEVISMFTKGTTISSGRWGLEHTDLLFPNFSLPWLWGAVSIGMVAVAAFLVIGIFEIKHKLLQYMIVGMMVCFPPLISTFAYMFTLPSDVLAILLSVLSVYIAVKAGNGIFSWIGSCVCLILSMSIYQAFLPLTIGLFILYLIYSMLNEADIDVKKHIITGIRLLLIIAASCGIYYWITQIELRSYNTEFNSIAKAALDFKGILRNIPMAYQRFVDVFTRQRASLIPTRLSKYVHLLLAIIVITRMSIIQIRKNPKAFICVLLLMLILPLGVNFLYIVITPDNIGTMESYGFVSIYILLAIVLDIPMDDNVSRLVKKTSLIAMAVVMASNVYVANRCWLQMQFAYFNLEAVYNTIVTQIYMQPGFDKDSKVVFIGELPDNQSIAPFSEEAQLEGIPYSMLNIYSRDYFLERYLDFNVPVVSKSAIDLDGEEIDTIIASMNVFPYYGYIQQKGEYILIKLSDG